jgi:membrane protease YdiL (CAAX protease family)
MALAFEGGLGVAAFGLGMLVGPPPLATLVRDPSDSWTALQATGVGLLAAVPMLAGLLLLDGLTWQPLRRLQTLVETQLRPLFAPLSVSQLLLLSLAAGVGEEMLFRGWLQEGLSRWMGPPLGAALALVLASLAFGACHWLTATYAVLAALVGAYLGGLYLFTDHLLAPVATHAAYDFVALLYLAKWKPPERPASFDQPPDLAEEERETADPRDAATRHENASHETSPPPAADDSSPA